MFLTKLKIATVTALVAIVLGTGATVLCRTSSATARPPEASDTWTFGDGNTVEGILQNPPEQAPATTRDDVKVPRYALQFQIIHKGLERTTDNDRDLKFGLTLPLGVPGKFRISEAGAVLSDAQRDHLGIFLQATVYEEKANSVKIELSLDDIGLVDGKADIKRLFSFRQEGPLGEVQECSVDPKAMPRQPTIKLTVHRLNEPQPPRPAIQPARGKNLQSDSSLPTSRSITQSGDNGLPSDAAGFKIEANAQGVKIQAQKFQGTAHRVSYDEANRLLVLEGSSEFPATIVFQKEQVRAVKIVYSLKEGTLNTESVKLLAR
jgi:LptA/(LptD N-terminal domain) LPS transport protein